MENEILINPLTAIRLFAEVCLSVGDDLLLNRKYKVTREAWIAAMFLLALEKEEKKDWWFTPVLDKSGSPDFNCFSFVRNENIKIKEKSIKGNEKHLIKLEVFEWRKEDPEDNFINALKKIKLDKIIDPEITILCYVRKNTVIPPVLLLIEKIKEISPKVKDIWYLGNIDPNSRFWRISQIYPSSNAIDLDYDEILLSPKEEHSFIHSYRGKSDKLEYEHTEKQILLTPEFELKEL